MTRNQINQRFLKQLNETLQHLHVSKLPKNILTQICINTNRVLNDGFNVISLK